VLLLLGLMELLVELLGLETSPLYPHSKASVREDSSKRKVHGGGTPAYEVFAS
jgi:hypothetical protein